MNNIIPIEEKLLLHLPAPEMAERLMAVPAGKRLEVLLARQDAEAVTAALPPQDFFLFVKEIGDESSAPLLSLCQPGQFSHVLDLEGWRGDVVNSGKMLVWCANLLHASEVKFIAWLYDADFELLVLLFKNWLDEVEVAGEKDFQEESDSLPKKTIDNQYYFSIRYPDYEEVIRFILSFLFEHHQSFYQALLHDVRFVLNADVEELAYRFHRGRLEDQAVPDFVEAGTIYRGIRRHALRKDKDLRSVNEDGGMRPPSFAVALLPTDDVLSAGLSRISDPGALDVLQQELVALANKVLVADDLEVADPASLKEAVAKAAAYVNLGLEEISGPDGRQAAEALGRHFLEELFRLGFSAISKVLAPLLAILEKGWIAQWPEGINILEPDWQEEISLLSLKTPKLLRQGAGGFRGEDHIRSRRDLQHIGDLCSMLQALEAVYAAIKREQKENWQSYAAELWQEGQNNTLAEVTLARLLFTAAARELWQGNWQYAPLPVANWPAIHGVTDIAGLSRKITEKSATMLPDEAARSLFDRYLAPVIAQYESERGAHPLVPPPDPRLVTFFLFTGRGKAEQRAKQRSQ